MKKQKIYFLCNSVDIERGGLTKASLKQASLFAELGYETEIITFNFNAYYPYIKQKLADLGKVHPNVFIRNMYEDIEGQKNSELKTKLKPANLKKLADGGALSKRNGHNAYRVLKNGYYTKYIGLGKGNTLKLIDYFNENRYRTRREEYDPGGNLKRTIYTDLETNKPRQTIYFDKKGRSYLSAWYSKEKDKYDHIHVFNKKGEITEEYTGDIMKLKQAWLKDLIKDDNNPVIISDTRSTDAILTGLKAKHAITIWRLHSHYLGAPYKDDSPIANKVEHGLNHMDKFDGVFLLTNQQKQDMSDNYGNGEKMYVIGHYHESSKSFLEKLKPTEKDKNRAVVISRLSTLKRVDHIIKAFRKVVDQLPNVKLDIYGKGTEEEKLRNLIEQLQLTNNVHMSGYTQNPDKAYENALFTALTSKSEGFSLSVLESMANKTPVISYDIKYGPNDLIEHGKNGYIVKDKNIDALAEKMIHLFENPIEAIKMGKNAEHFIQDHFSKKSYAEKWENYVQHLIEQKSRVQS
ncbi:glycosyltransferase [Virgibacillus profundi]|nr:glycosyltransferase [Virgibacillus profundi]